MRILRLSDERTLSDVLESAYGITAMRTAAAKRAEAGILNINPHLRDLKELPKGTVVLVPDVPQLKPTQQTEPATAVIGDLLSNLPQAMDSALEALAARTDKTLRADRETLERLKASAAAEEVRKSPALKAWISAAMAHTQERVVKVEAAASAQQDALKKLSSTVHEFAKDAGQRRPSKLGDAK